MKKENFIIVVCGIMWGFVGIISSQILGYNFSTYNIVEFRFLFSVIILFVVLLIFNKSLLKPKNLPQCCILGVCNLLTFICYYNAIKYLGGGTASVLLYTSPIMVTVYSCITKKSKLTLEIVLAIILCMLGCMLSSRSKMSFNLKGFMWGLGSGFFNSLISIFGAKIKNQSKISVNFYSFLTASIIGIIFIKPNNLKAFYTTNVAIWFVLLSVICTVLPYILYMTALKEGQEGIAILLSTSEPITANIIQMIVDKQVNFVMILGLLCLVGAVVLTSVKIKAKPKNKFLLKH